MKLKNFYKVKTPALVYCLCFAFLFSSLWGETPEEQSQWSVKMTQSVMQRNADIWSLDFRTIPKWSYTFGVVYKGMWQVSEKTGDEKIIDYIKRYYDAMINDEGEIRTTYKIKDYNIDQLNSGKVLFDLYKKTHNEKYKKVIETLRQQMKDQPRTKEGGFWHKKIYPHQMWLDGLYMGSPFLTQYAAEFDESALFDDVANQFILINKYTRDAKTGLLYHGWDESRSQKWANPETGCSPNFWGRGMGWYSMALVDTLDYFPKNHPKYKELLKILEQVVDAVSNYQDPETGLWYQVLDKKGAEGNYLESSCSTMFVYSILKAVRRGYVSQKYLTVAEKGYQGIIKNFIETDANGQVHINQACAVAGLGGNPYRDGSYQYYVSEKIATDDPKAIGPFILASVEYEMLNNSEKAKAKVDAVVAADGSGQYKTVQDAINAAPQTTSPDNQWVILIKPGIYKEVVYVQREKRFVRIVGEDAAKTVITYDLNANIVGQDGKPIGTFRTPTVFIDADNFTAENITFENSAGPVGQALAIRVDGDRVVFRNCRFLGWQDTILVNRGRQYFENCYIAGHVDFIFGGATIWFENCRIHCLRDGYITAASTPDTQPFGYVFSNCRITGEDGVKTYLGRPWRDFASVVWLNTEMSDVVRLVGWHNWNKPERERTTRYAELNSKGPGSNPSARASWARGLTQDQAKTITLKNVLAGNDGWNPATDR